MNRVFKSAFVALLASCVPASIACLTAMTSVYYDHRINFANFDSYMSINTQSKLSAEYNCNLTISYGTNDELEAKFADYYDVAVASSYEVASLYELGCLQKIDWKKFHLNGDKGEQINTSQEAMTLFETDETDKEGHGIPKIITGINNQINDKFGLKPNTFNILDYAIPYFYQNVQFVYHSASLKKDPDLKEDPDNWNQLIDDFIGCSSLPKSSESLIMVDDYQTVHNVASLVEEKWDIPIPDSYNSFSDFKTTYDTFANKFKQTPHLFKLTPDSGKLVETFVDRNTKTDYMISYSGDVLYSFLGGGDLENALPTEQFHPLQPKKNVCFCDFLIVNKKTDLGRKDVYKVLEKLCFDQYNEVFNDDKEIAKLSKQDEEGIYHNETVENFSKVLYTPVLKKFYKYLQNKESNNFWKFYSPEEEDWKKYRQILKYSENGLNDWKFDRRQRSNGLCVWQEIKERL